MSKSKKNKHQKKLKKRAEPIVKNIPTKIEKLKVIWKRIKGVVTSLTVICSVTWAVYTSCKPKISIVVSELLNPFEPLNFPFDIKNMGNFDVKNFSYYLTVSKIAYEGDLSISNSDFKGLEKIIPLIKPDYSYPIDIKKIAFYNIPIKEAEIIIRYNYSTLPVINMTFRDSVRFILKKDFENKYRWKYH